MTKSFFFIISMVACANGLAQQQFILKGKIEFERKINVHRQMEGEEDTWYKEMISRLPRYYTSYFDLYFNDDTTVYKPGRESEPFRNWWLIGPAKDNMVLTSINRGESKSNKKVFEETYLLQDSTSRVRWKITEEMRNIAGFECRKAVGIICDSVYVVAFYTDEIAVSGGPESFNGLPGMILGLAIPRLYTTWFATKLELVDPTPKDLSISTRGKKISQTDLQVILQKSLKDWGKQAHRNIWWVLL